VFFDKKSLWRPSPHEEHGGNAISWLGRTFAIIFLVLIAASANGQSVLSIVLSIATNRTLERQHQSALPDVIRAKRVELIDTQGRVRSTFELVNDGRGGVFPLLLMRNGDGRDMVELDVDNNGNGVLSFSSEYWNEGAVILGHLDLVDTQSIDDSIKDGDKQGAWGLQIRSPQK